MLSQFGTNYDCGYPTYQQPFCSREIRWRRAYFRKFLEFFPIFWKYPLYLSWYKGRQGNTLVLLLLSQSYLADHSTPTPILAANLLRPNLSQIVVFIPVRHIPARRVPYRAEKSRLYATYNWIGQSDTFRMCWAKRRVRQDISIYERGLRINGNGATNTSAASSFGKAVGRDAHMGMMILALATRHRVERPAMSMEGGTIILWSGPARRHLISLWT